MIQPAMHNACVGECTPNLKYTVVLFTYIVCSVRSAWSTQFYVLTYIVRNIINIYFVPFMLDLK